MHNDKYHWWTFFAQRRSNFAEFKETLSFFPSSFRSVDKVCIYIFFFVFLLLFFIFILASPSNVNGKSLCRKQSFCPAFQAATFVPLFLGLTVIRRYDDRYVNRCFADFRPGCFSPHRACPSVQSSPSNIDAAKRSSVRSQCSNMHFPENCKSEPARISLDAVRLPTRNLSQQAACFF